MVFKNIKKLVTYGLDKGLLSKDDEIYTVNKLIDILGLDSFEDCDISGEEISLEAVLKGLCDYAVEKGLIEDGITYRDLFDTRLMSALMPRPSEVRRTFYEKYAQSPELATDYYYKLSRDSDYIREYRIAKYKKWVYSSKWGDLDITINLSRPENDPKSIAAAKNAPQVGYPKCLLCVENEGYAGRVNHPARNNHRVMPIVINGSDWFMQYSPYVYYNEHCIAFNKLHTPMKIERATFAKLLSFVEQFPHYFVGSNADLPIVGGSILSHDHFQGGRYDFAMAMASIETELKFKDFDDVEGGIVKWPMSCIRIKGKDIARLVELADKILLKWRAYTDEKAFVFAETDGEKHNTITPIARYRDGKYELDLVLRNNITTPEHPMGLYHPHSELHNIKKENIGLIEVMGLAVLPPRLDRELTALADCIVKGIDFSNDELLSKHKAWFDGFKNNYDDINAENVDDILRTEVGKAFAKVLEHAGVYKTDAEGREAFMRFIDEVNN